MADPIIPTPQDAQLVMQSLTTKTAAYNTPGLDQGSGYSPGGPGQPVAAVVQVSALDLADANETYSFTLQESADNSTFTPAGAAAAVTAVGTVVVTGRVRQRYLRLALATGGTTPSITFKAWLNPLP